MREEQTRFRETITASAEAEGRFARQTGGRNQFAVVRLRVEPLGRGKGIEFVNALAEGVLPQEYIKPIEDGVRASLEQGFVRRYPMTDLRVTLLDGSYHETNSSATAFQIAGSIGLKEAVIKAHPIVIEPDAD